MQNLTCASEELFRRGPDECFVTFDALWQHCQEAKARSVERWHPPTELRVEPCAGQLRLLGGGEATYRLNDWSFTQLCSLSGVSKDTVNRLSAATASQVFAETLPGGSKPLQFLTVGSDDAELVRAVHGAAYTRLFDADLLAMVREFATDFQPPQEAAFAAGGQPVQGDGAADGSGDAGTTRRGGTGLYRGEQDMSENLPCTNVHKSVHKRRFP
jgi:hypothetical protein